jgi:putative tricarboxylic transport membrane protein
MVLGCILGPQAENAFMTSMLSFHNDWTVFFTRPMAGTIMVLVILSLVYPLARHLRQRRKEALLQRRGARERLSS